MRLFRKPTRAASARVVPLMSTAHDDDGTTTNLRCPDSLAPLDHRMPGELPNEADCRLAVTQLVQTLADRGALDEGSGAVLDYLLDSRLAGWIALVDREAEERRVVAARLVATDTENVVRVTEHAAQLEAEHRRALASYEANLAELQRGRPAAAAAALRSPGPNRSVPKTDLPVSDVGRVLERSRSRARTTASRSEGETR